LAKNTKVFTKDGIKTLSDVAVGDFIYSDSCDLVKVVNKVESCKTQGLKITLKGNVKIDTTEDHLFYLNGGSEVKAGDIRIGDILLSGDSSEKPNIVLDLAQFITVVNEDLRGSRGGSIFEDYVKIYHNAPKVRRFVTVDGDFCWALGLVIAEGSKSSISLHEDELGLANKFLDIYKKITGLEFENSDKFYFREDVKSLHVAIPSPKIYEALFFKACGIGYGARNKSMAIGFEMSEKLVLKLINLKK
jgi:intein/homing endonuclease